MSSVLGLPDAAKRDQYPVPYAILDIWTPTCRDARLFGRHSGTAVLVPRPRGAAPDTLLTGRLGGAAAR